MPRHLCKTAKKVWRQTCDILREMGMLSRTDAHLLEHYSITYAVREMHGFNPVDGLNDDYTNEPAGESHELPPATPEEQTDET